MLRSLSPAWKYGTGAWRRDPARWSVLLVLALASAATGAWAALLMLPRRPHPAAVVESPVEVGSWSIGWGRTMQPPEVEQAIQLEVLSMAATAAALLACAVACFAGSLLWRQRVVVRRAEYLLARAVGAQRRHVLASLAGEAWPWAIAVAVGSAGLTALVTWLTLVTFPGEVRVGAGVSVALLAPLALAAVVACVEAGGLKPGAAERVGGARRVRIAHGRDRRARLRGALRLLAAPAPRSRCAGAGRCAIARDLSHFGPERR
jgi:hypothetical protein